VASAVINEDPNENYKSRANLASDKELYGFLQLNEQSVNVEIDT
jgi:hypothetical protein